MHVNVHVNVQAVAALRAEGFGCVSLHRECHRTAAEGGSVSSSSAAAAAAAATADLATGVVPGDVITDLRSLRTRKDQQATTQAAAAAAASTSGSSSSSPSAPAIGVAGGEAAAAAPVTKRNGSDGCLQWAQQEDSPVETTRRSSLATVIDTHTDTGAGAGAGSGAGAGAGGGAGAGSSGSDCRPPEQHRTVLNLDQGMLALLVANVWELTVEDMVASGCVSVLILLSELFVLVFNFRNFSLALCMQGKVPSALLWRDCLRDPGGSPRNAAAAASATHLSQRGARRVRVLGGIVRALPCAAWRRRGDRALGGAAWCGKRLFRSHVVFVQHDRFPKTGSRQTYYREKGGGQR